MAKPFKAGDVWIDANNDGTASAPIAAGRTALGNEFLPAPRNNAITPVTGRDININSIDKHGYKGLCGDRRGHGYGRLVGFLEKDKPVNNREQRVVASPSNIKPGMPLRSSLAS